MFMIIIINAIITITTTYLTSDGDTTTNSKKISTNDNKSKVIPGF